jgi:DNA-binding CsgD family transcriptional regulator
MSFIERGLVMGARSNPKRVTTNMNAGDRLRIKEFFHPRVLREHIPVIIYFAASLFCVMSVEFMTDLKAAQLWSSKSEYLVYGTYSMCVAVGVGIFYLFRKRVKTRAYDRVILLILFFIAAVLTVMLIFVSIPSLLIAIVLCLYLLVGFNTGIASVCLYQLYQKKAPTGRILSAASLIGLTLHYFALRLTVGNAIFAVPLAALIVVGIALMYFLLAYKIPTIVINHVESHTESLKNRKDRSKYVRSFCGTIAVIALISFIIGMSDSIVATELPSNAPSASFFYPVLFYLPGQVIACLLVDIKKGKYLVFSTLAGAILLVPVTLWLQSPEEVYLNAGINFFVGGFFLAYIMTAIISIASRAKHRLFAICVTGMVYPLFCGIGGFMTPPIINDMGFQMMVIVYSLMVVLLAALSFSQYTLWQPEPAPKQPPAPRTPSLGELIAGYGITNREIKVLELLIEGKSTAEIAKVMAITDKSVRNYVSSLMAKTASSSRGKLVARFTGRAS